MSATCGATLIDTSFRAGPRWCLPHQSCSADVATDKTRRDSPPVVRTTLASDPLCTALHHRLHATSEEATVQRRRSAALGRPSTRADDDGCPPSPRHTPSGFTRQTPDRSAPWKPHRRCCHRRRASRGAGCAGRRHDPVRAGCQRAALGCCHPRMLSARQTDCAATCSPARLRPGHPRRSNPTSCGPARRRHRRLPANITPHDPAERVAVSPTVDASRIAMRPVLPPAACRLTRRMTPPRKRDGDRRVHAKRNDQCPLLPPGVAPGARRRTRRSSSVDRTTCDAVLRNPGRRAREF